MSCIVIGPENSRHFLKTKTHRYQVTRLFPRLLVLRSHWLLIIFPFPLIGCCVDFGSGFTTVNRNASHLYFTSNTPWGTHNYAP